MTKANKQEADDAAELNKKLEAIIEQSTTENAALKKILKGLEKMNNKETLKKIKTKNKQ